MEKIKTSGKKFNCQECKNECDLTTKTYQAGDIFECPMCGIEYEVTNVDTTGEMELQLIEDEK